MMIDNIEQDFNMYTDQSDTEYKRAPRVDLFESDYDYYFRLSIPGVKREHLEIFINSNGQLEVIGKIEPTIPSVYQGHYREVYSGPIRRIINLPPDIDRSRIRFNYDLGILEIYIGKQPE